LIYTEKSLRDFWRPVDEGDGGVMTAIGHIGQHGVFGLEKGMFCVQVKHGFCSICSTKTYGLQHLCSDYRQRHLCGVFSAPDFDGAGLSCCHELPGHGCVEKDVYQPGVSDRRSEVDVAVMRDDLGGMTVASNGGEHT